MSRRVIFKTAIGIAILASCGGYRGDIPTRSTTSAPLTDSMRATRGLLDVENLPIGFLVEKVNVSAASGYVKPTCQQLRILEGHPELEKDARRAFVSSDGRIRVEEFITLAPRELLLQTLDAYSEPSTIVCLKETFAEAFGQTDALPGGAVLQSVDVSKKSIFAGEAAIGYLIDVAATIPDTRQVINVSIEISIIRVDAAVIGLSVVSLPGAMGINVQRLEASSVERLVAALS